MDGGEFSPAGLQIYLKAGEKTVNYTGTADLFTIKEYGKSSPEYQTDSSIFWNKTMSPSRV